MDSSTQNNSTISHQLPSSLCKGGCGFFGTLEKKGLCSKCYDDEIVHDIMSLLSDEDVDVDAQINKLIDALNSAAIFETDKISSSVIKTRCICCNKKVGLLGFVCRCGETFCSKHRYPEVHPCTFDYKAAGKIVIEKENPLCKADKMPDRV